MTRRIASLWFENLPMERFLRHEAIKTPFALVYHHKNAERIYALNIAARQAGLSRDMGVGDAHSLCANLTTSPANPQKDFMFLKSLARFAQSYCPWVGLNGMDCLALDVTGSAHLWGGEAQFSKKAEQDFAQLGLSVKIGIAPTKGAAWALSHFGSGQIHDAKESLRDFPIAALRIDGADEILARRLGLQTIGDLYDKPRGQLARRFGDKFLIKLDQILGEQFENIDPLPTLKLFATRMSFPEPIGLYDDVMAGIERLLAPLCAKLLAHHLAMTGLKAQFRLTDGKVKELKLRFARPMRIVQEILPLLGHHVEKLDVEFGVDQMRLMADDLRSQAPEQITSQLSAERRKIDDLLTRIGNRIGFDNIKHLNARDTHIPAKRYGYQSFDTPVSQDKEDVSPRPFVIFTPEPITARTPQVPERFTWRRMKFQTKRIAGPERIAPEWWCENEGWDKGVRDYWRVATQEGRRFWMFYTPQNPAWYVEGEFA